MNRQQFINSTVYLSKVSWLKTKLVSETNEDRRHNTAFLFLCLLLLGFFSIELFFPKKQVKNSLATEFVHVFP